MAFSILLDVWTLRKILRPSSFTLGVFRGQFPFQMW
jgi:hypothetical protein